MKMGEGLVRGRARVGSRRARSGRMRGRGMVGR